MAPEDPTPQGLIKEARFLIFADWSRLERKRVRRCLARMAALIEELQATSKD